MKVKKTSTIKINVGLDENQMPVKIEWEAEGGPNGVTKNESKAILLSLFDKDTKDTMKIDLWTNEMQVIEMDRFFFQTMRALADTYFKATNNREMAIEMQKFVQYFGETTKILKSPS